MSELPLISSLQIGDMGEIRLTSCPGRRSDGLHAELVQFDIERLGDSGAVGVISLVEAKEFPGGMEHFAAALQQAGLKWQHLPIVDYGVPDDAFERSYSEFALADRIASGEVWAIHCMGGLGRSGTIAARLLIEAGMSSGEAIETVRASHDRRAVETTEQEAYLASVSAQ